MPRRRTVDSGRIRTRADGSIETHSWLRRAAGFASRVRERRGRRRRRCLLLSFGVRRARLLTRAP